MKSLRILLAFSTLLVTVGIAYVAQQTDPTGTRAVVAAQAFLDTLTAEQKAKTVFDYDSGERTNWYYTPQQKGGQPTRKGIPLESMNEAQKKAALNLLQVSTSEYGSNAANTVRSMENILKEVEKNGTQVRNPDWYFVTVFGTPSKTGKWGWRFEGHHVSFNFTLDGGQLVASTPFFIGANPAEVKTGDRKGLKVIGPSDDLARELINALDNEQKTVADVSKSFAKGVPESVEASKSPKIGDAVGLVAAKMTDKQKDLLTQLMKHYTDRMPSDQADREWKDVKDAGFDKIYFCYTGTNEVGKGHTYRIHGPTFVVEFINQQADGSNNPANHIHSAWRRMKGDFGLN